MILYQLTRPLIDDTQNSRIEAVSIQGLLGGNNKYLDG